MENKKAAKQKSEKDINKKILILNTIGIAILIFEIIAYILRPIFPYRIDLILLLFISDIVLFSRSIDNSIKIQQKTLSQKANYIIPFLGLGIYCTFLLAMFVPSMPGAQSQLMRNLVPFLLSATIIVTIIVVIKIFLALTGNSQPSKSENDRRIIIINSVGFFLFIFRIIVVTSDWMEYHSDAGLSQVVALFGFIIPLSIANIVVFARALYLAKKQKTKTQPQKINHIVSIIGMITSVVIPPLEILLRFMAQ